MNETPAAGRSTDSRFAEFDALTTEQLRQRAFALARHRGDVRFFWHLMEHLPSADDTESVDGSTGSIGTSIEDAIGLWREFTGHRYGDREPLIRASFLDYVMRHAR